MRVEQGITRRAIRRVRRDGTLAPPIDDEIVVEEPLQIRLAGEVLLTTMRTPGDDSALVLGLLWAEGLITSLADVSAIASCGQPGDAIVDVRPGPGVVFDVAPRAALSNAACGVCGRAQINDLRDRLGAFEASPIAIDVLRSGNRMLADQPRFARTGALHAAAIVGRAGSVLASAEDVGRHNAVDKVVGMLLTDGCLDEAQVLLVSGRASFEMVQKAAAARIGAVLAVGAPTSLAIDLAVELGMVLVGFAREDTLNVYAGAAQIS